MPQSPSVSVQRNLYSLHFTALTFKRRSRSPPRVRVERPVGKHAVGAFSWEDTSIDADKRDTATTLWRGKQVHPPLRDRGFETTGTEPPQIHVSTGEEIFRFSLIRKVCA